MLKGGAGKSGVFQQFYCPLRDCMKIIRGSGGVRKGGDVNFLLNEG